MIRQIAVKSSVKLIGDTSELKRYLLLFDQIAVKDLKGYIEFHYCVDQSDNTSIFPELEYLAERDVLIDPEIHLHLAESNKELSTLLSNASSTRDELQLHVGSQVLSKETITPEFMDKFMNLTGLFEDLIARFIATQINNTKEASSVALLACSSCSFMIPSHQKSDAFRVVINNLPIPSDTVPWEQIFEFKADPDSKSRMLALKNWMRNISRSSFSAQEIEDELEYLLDQYRRHLEYHNLKHTIGCAEAVFVSGGQFLENLLKLKFGQIAKTVFSFKKSRLYLLEAEMQAPGREVSYFQKARDEFCSTTSS